MEATKINLEHKKKLQKIIVIMCEMRLCTSSSKSEIAEIHPETNIIEEKDLRKEYRRNRDPRYEDRRNRGRRILSMIHTSILLIDNLSFGNHLFRSLF